MTDYQYLNIYFWAIQNRQKAVIKELYCNVSHKIEIRVDSCCSDQNWHCYLNWWNGMLKFVTSPKNYNKLKLFLKGENYED